MSSITLEKMHFYAYHGCFAEEQAIGTHFRLDVTYETDTSRAQQTDNIADTVSYLSVYQTIKREMQKPSHLLEHVVRVSKLAPPLGGELDAVTVEITKDRCRQS